MKTIKEAAVHHCNRSQFKSDFPHDYRSEESGFIAGIEFAQRWIPVEEELPEEGELVQAKFEIRHTDTYVKSGYTYATCSVNKFTNELWLVDNNFNGGIVTHWRPIEYK